MEMLWFDAIPALKALAEMWGYGFMAMVAVVVLFRENQ